MREFAEFTKTQTHNVLEGVRVLDVQEPQVHVSPVVIRLAPRGEVPLDKVIALLIPVCTEHEEEHR